MFRFTLKSGVAAAIAVASLSVHTAFAAMAPERDSGKPSAASMRMFDSRVNGKDAWDRAIAARPDASRNSNTARATATTIATTVAAQTRANPGLTVNLSTLTGAPTSISHRIGTLTAAAPGKSSENIVRDYLRGPAGALMGLSVADVGDLYVLGDSAGGYSGMRMLRIEQRIDGRPVFQSESRFSMDRDGRLVKYVGQMVPNARALATESTVGLMTPAAASSRLLASLGKSVSEGTFSVTSVAQDGRTELTSTDSYLAGPVTAREVLFPLAPGVLVPAWSLVAFTSDKADWYSVVDARTGEVLWRKNIRNYVSTHDARFRVYVQADGKTPADNPAPLSPTTATPGSGLQGTAIAPTIVSMHAAMSATASPNGWIDDCPGGTCTANETQTLGNNVLACLDRTGGANANICDTDAASVLDGNGRPTGNPDANGRNRDFLGTAPRDFQTNFLPPPQGGNDEAGQTPTGNGNNGTLAIDQFRRGVVTHLFYVTNWYHDQTFLLGFDEASANFQQTNFSGMGVGGDRVLADVQDGAGTNNANFATPPDGTSGRMQMFRFTGPTIDRDGSLDAEIVIHELTHGLSNRLVGNGAGLNWDPAGGMGEGWSDFYALSLLNNTAADDPNGSYASGAYATYKLIAGYTDNYLYGIRRFPYSTSLSVNPMTWADVDDVTINLAGGIAPSPVNFNDNGGMEVHNSGEIWANTLWQMRANIIAGSGGGSVPAGNQIALQLVTDALKLTPIDPSFVDARDALFDADCANNACANEQSIWSAFAKRGLGYRAEAPYKASFGYTASHVGIRESFAVPYLDVKAPLTDVVINDSATNNNGAIDPGEAFLMNVRLFNPWRAAAQTSGAISATLTTATPGVTIYTGTTTYPAIAAQGQALASTPFKVGVAPSVTAGTAISFVITTTSALGTTSATFTVRVGTRNGTDPVVTYTNVSALTIPDNRPRAVFNALNVTDDFEIADVDLRIDSATHTFTGDLTFMLRSPDGIGMDQISLIGALTDGGSGDNITNMVVDGDVARTTANDMAQVVAAAAPYTKSWAPVFNSPWAALAGFPDVSSTTDTMQLYDGRSTLGTWNLAASDQFQLDSGTLNSWSILVTPVHFDVAAVAATANVAGTMTVAGTFVQGGTVTYTVVLTNSGSGNQGDNAGAEFTNTLPAGLTLTGASATSGTATTAGNQVNWNGSLAPIGGTVTITITATINAGTTGTVSNQGAVLFDITGTGVNNAAGQTDDPSVAGPGNPTTFVVAAASVTATKTVSGTFAVGGTVTYTVTISNSGTGATVDNPGNEFTDVLPSGVTLVSASATSGAVVPTIGSNTVTWNGALPAGGSVTITITATVNASAAGTTVSNQGTVLYDADLNGTNETTVLTDDPGVGGATDPTSFSVNFAAVTATKTVSAGPYAVGGSVVYTIVMSNSGNIASADNAGNELTDVLPFGLSLISANASSGTAVATLGTNTVTWNGSVPAGGSVTITINALINSGASGNTVSNQASFVFDADGNGSNESSGVTDDPAVPGAGNATSFAVAAEVARPIPTMSIGALIALITMLLGSGLMIGRRRTR